MPTQQFANLQLVPFSGWTLPGRNKTRIDDIENHYCEPGGFSRFNSILNVIN